VQILKEIQLPSPNAVDLSRHRHQTLQRVRSLPPFPATAVRLLAISTGSDTAMRDFEAVFKADPALATELLRAANSAEFGFRAKIASIRHALALMGLEAVRSLAFRLSLHAYAGRSPHSVAIQSIWAHSLATAAIAERLGRVANSQVPLLYTASLLHDIGRLGLILGVGQPYTLAMQREYETLAEANEMERLVFGVTHAEAGAVLAEHWALPEILADCIRNHHIRPAVGPLGILELVQVACQLADTVGFPELLKAPALDDSDVRKGWPGYLTDHPELAPGRLKRLAAENISDVFACPRLVN